MQRDSGNHFDLPETIDPYDATGMILRAYHHSRVRFQVREHLVFFGKLKGAPENIVNEEAEELVRKFELTPKMDVLSRNLSGGMKRKLSMANAMVGGSSVHNCFQV